MMKFQREFICEVVGEVEPLLNQHYQELVQERDQIKIDPRWEDYAALERMGFFHVFTARADGKLVGYGAFFLNKHLHHASLTSAVNDVLFLHPDHRSGMTGIKLIRFCESELKAMGADKLCIHAKQESTLHLILERLGYTAEEITMSKTFKEN